MPIRTFRADVLAALYGAWRLAHGDRSGMRWFDGSLIGFWRSFAAAGVAAPPYVLLVLMNRDLAGPDATLGVTLPIDAASYVLQWVLFPLAMVPVCRSLGLGARYVPFVVAFNWSAAVQVFAFMPIALMQWSGLLPPPLVGPATLFAFGAVLLYQWFVTRVALASSAQTAAAIVALDVALALLVEALAARFA